MDKKYISVIDIYTDGSLRRTRDGIICGYGIYFPNRELKNVAAPFNDGKLTNNRAELYAIYRAIARVKKRYTFDTINIYTDSEYSQKSLTVWIKNWKKNNWQTSNRKPVVNQDIIRKIDRYLETYKGKINIQWVRAHTGRNDIHSINNSEADRLANKGADKYREKYMN